MSRRRRAERPPEKRGPGLVPQVPVLIVCEGRKTEPRYLVVLCRRKGLTAVEAIWSGGGSDPMSVVECAIARRDAANQAGSPYDQIWCVFDKDEHEWAQKALEQARANGIGVAFSNPCIELWLLLHFRDSAAYVERGDAELRLRSDHMAGYSKSMDGRAWGRIYADALEPREAEACQRAGALRRYHEQNHGNLHEITWNPYSSVDRLICYLRELAAARQLP